ncbi:MAG TPA: 2-C-methyl-D-erythritol 4-phosphate cytidylyltransferase [Puia sp.]|nr:2-C-methyl-D-erythritol 4-phosphate cytidylyltransferase [Puia sp.]
MKKYAVIVAGGAGTRMGTDTPKQFLELCGRPILWYTLNTFLSAYEDMPVVLVAPEHHQETTRALVATTAFPARIEIVAGGATRFESVRNGLATISEESVIFVHDGVRCLVSRELIHRCYAAALQYGSAIPVVDSKDSVRLLTPNGNEAIDRHRVKLVQTPQTFLSKLLIPAYRVAYREGFTDEASVVEAAGHPIHLVEGELDNIKITVPADLTVAERVLSF